MPRSLCLRVLIVVVLLATASPAFAKMGLEAGLSLDPDDFVVGLRWNHPVGTDGSLSLVPSVDAGFGDLTFVAGNLDLDYKFKTSSDLRPYIGGGINLHWFDFDGGSDTEVGGTILGGLFITPQVGLEGRFGLGDVPDIKILALFNLK